MIKNSIGGYFEFELFEDKSELDNRLLFNSGRSAFAFLLKHHKIRAIQLPRYTCDVMLEPLKELGITFSFYGINHNLLPDFTAGEIDPKVPMVINNYFGILDSDITQYCSNPLVIIDNSQALYSKVTGGLGSFNSFRKFMGLPDGAEATMLAQREDIKGDFIKFKGTPGIRHLFGRIEDGPELHYNAFQEAEKRLTFKEIKAISEISKRAFLKVNHNGIAFKRKNNFNFLHKKLASLNELDLKFSENCVPSVYPFLVRNGNELKKRLIASNIFVPTYWSNREITCLENSFEFNLIKNLVALPVDQRYGINEMKLIFDLIND